MEHKVDEDKAIISEYGDYIKCLKKQDKEEGLAYWGEIFSDYDEISEIKPMMKPEQTKQLMERIGISLEKDVSDRLIEMASSNNIKINTVAEAAWGIILQKYNNTNDAVFGKVVSGRNASIKGIKALYINTIPVRVKCHDGMTILELLQELYKQETEGSSYDYCSPAEVQSLTKQGIELIKTLFVFEDYYINEEKLKSGENELQLAMESAREQRNYPISVSVKLGGGTLNYDILYNPNEYEKSEIESILARIKKVLQEMSLKPQAKVTEIEIVIEEEKSLILNEFNDTYAEYKKEKTVAELFEEQAAKTPHNIAVVYEEEEITYAKLNKRANQLARKLRRMGVKPDDFVAIMAERSIEMIAGIYGIIKAGGAYVPIDPTYPKDRKEYILNDCKPKVLLTYKAEIETEIPVVDLADSRLWKGNSENLDIVNNPENLLYVIYTSGTTGKPKGVMIENTGVSNLKEYFKNKIGVREEDRVLQFANVVFDASVWEISMAILNGACLVLIPNKIISEPEKFTEYCNSHGVTVASLPPNYFIQTKGLEAQLIITAGSESGMLVLENAGNSRYINGYGPTETTVAAAYWEYKEKDKIFNTVPIGKPMPNTQIYILQGSRLCGIGIPGELCITGDGLARGYLNRPELTAEKFIDNPFGEGKMYRSGDLARWLTDGNIEYLGRIDQQVKIRGFRIELGEVESVLRKIEAVTDAAVIAREDKNGEKAIYAYVVSEKKVSISEIREILRSELPEYMIPSYMKQIEKIPVTINGKVDKRALPAIEAKTEKEYIAPRNEIEEILCNLFSEILGAEKVGINDSFFELGGHSLRATRLANRIEAKTGSRIALKDIFVNTTPRMLAELITGKEEEEYIPIPKAEEKEYYPMSSTQKRIYLINQMDVSSTAYNLPQYLKVTGEVSPASIRTALQEMINRHEILRTDFIMVNGEPVQKIKEAAEADFEYEEDTKTPESELMKIFVKPFDLGSSPLVRMKLVKRQDHSLLMIDMHHIVGDGMSMGTFIREFTALYNGEKPERLVHQYKDYSEWMQNRDLSSQREYWINEFKEDIPILDMPIDFPRPQQQSFKGAMAACITERELGDKLKAIARKSGATEYMIFLSAAMVMLGKYSRQEDIIIGSPISGRTHKDTESMLGMFVNTLAMRGRPEGRKNYNEFLKEVKESCLKAYENQEYPFEELVEAVQITRDMSRNPLFDVMLVLQNNEEEQFKLKGTKAEYAGTESTIAKFDLTFNITEAEGSFEITLEYCTDLFKEESAKGMLEHYVRVLEQIAEAPNVMLSEIEVITEEEKSFILNEFNDTYAEYPREKTAAELFEEQAEKTPDNTAVVYEDEEVTYAELNKRANVLAHKLRALGVKPDDFIVIMAERSIEMIAGIYGIIKAGGAYVPIDPTYPKDRIEYMLNDCKPKAVLTYKAEIETEVPVIDLTDSRVWEGTSENPAKVNGPSDLLYVIYTSGTTGKPKGVMVENKGVVSLKSYLTKLYEVNERDSILQFANYVFDASVWEMTMALLSGAVLQLVPNTIISDINGFDNFVNEKEITITLLPPQYYIQTEPDGLKILTTGGSASNPETVRKSKGKYRYINAYGPTENTVIAAHWEYNGENDIPNNIPIGKPISNTQIYILQGSRLCGIGVPGELCIAGDGLARGYLNRPELTIEKFVDNPFGEGKLYRSGDLARWLTDGNIEYLGRIDEQVKIRGFRIELGEVESVLRKIEAITDAAVIAREDKNGEKAIYAYVVSEKKISISEIREILRSELPEYMIPSYMLQIEKIPVTRNGKVDKRALPAIEVKTEKEYIAPRNEIEEILCNLFSEILGVKKVGINDSFFELGGHSLRATRLANRIEAKTGSRIALKDIFVNTTPRMLAELITGKEEEEYIPIPKAEEKEYYPMSSTQKRIYLINQMDVNSTAYNMPQKLKLIGEVSPDAIRKALQEMINRHEILRTDFIMVNGEPVQKIKEAAEADFAYEEDTKTPESELMKIFVKPFDLGSSPLVRMKLVKREDHSLLMIDMHHIVGDGMSMGTFIREFTALYNGEKPERLAHQYKDYSEWMQKRDLSSQREYWINEFREDIPVLDMPIDFPRPQQQSFKGAAAACITERELGDKIKTLARKSGATEYMIFLSAAMMMLGKYSRQEDIIIGSPISGRTHKDTESMLGMFVNTLAMRGRPEGRKNYNEFLKEVKESCLKAYENQEYPFEELVEAVQITRDMSRNPLFDVMLVLQNNEEEQFKLKGTEAEYAGAESTIAKFDLTFNITEAEGSFGITLEYCTDLFKEESAKGMLEHYVRVLEQIAEAPNVMLSEIEIITEEEKSFILNEFNDTYAEYPREKTVAELFEEQAEKTPDSIAVVYEEEEVTYAELNKKANQLARRLREMGVRPDDFVAVMAERSIEMIAGIYGIIKSGGAYVPIDPTYPKDRIEYMLNDCKPKAVLTYKAEIETEVPVIDLSDSRVWEGNSENLEIVNSQEDILYVIYTSGTTGKPKGVMVENKGVVSLKSYLTKLYEVNERDSILQFANYVFDASVWEMTMALLSGAVLQLVPNTIISDINGFNNFVNEKGITITLLPPQYYIQTEPAGLKILTTGGSASNPETIRKLKGKYRYINAYGPTENTVIAAHWEYDGESDIPNNIPIGKPISNTQIYILQGSRLCGIGVPGELCIAGDGLARGYLNRPELTAEKFIDNPFGKGKLYRSGDLARWLTDGNIEYLGRIDEQVKIRGYRIELGEIESVLRKIEYVTDAAVIAREDKNGEKAIYAYVVSEKEISTSEIREILRSELPEYMIPSYMMKIERIAVTRNGKLDKRALPEIETKSEKEYAAPRNETEKKMCEIFANVLNIKQLGIEDNIFELGANSLKIIQIVSDLLKAGIKIRLQSVFEYKSIKSLYDNLNDETSADISVEANDTVKYEKYNKMLCNNFCDENVKIEEKNLGSILVTGATGFLGAHIAANLVENEQGSIYCLVRSSDVSQAYKKLKAVFNYYFSDRYDDLFGKRIVAIPGDICMSSLENCLPKEINTIIHSAANTKHYGFYKDFYSVNVEGIKNIVNYAKNVNAALIYISTPSVCAAVPQDTEDITFNERHFFKNQSFESPYVRSKFEAEMTVMDAIENGLDSIIIRVGNLTNRYSDAKSMIDYESNSFLSMIKSFVKFGFLTEEMMNMQIQFSPIDEIADGVVRLSKNRVKNYFLYHLFNDREVPLKTVVDSMKQIGIHVETSNASEEDLMKNIKSSSKMDYMFKFLVTNETVENYKPTIHKNDFTKSFMKKLGFEMREIDQEYINRVIVYYDNLGYWKKD